MVFVRYSHIIHNSNLTNMEKVSGYCVKCRVKPGREMKDVSIVEIKPGRFAAKGTCTVCGTGMYRILSKDKASELKKSL